jgi:hypothetical protein
LRKLHYNAVFGRRKIGKEEALNAEALRGSRGNQDERHPAKSTISANQ